MGFEKGKSGNANGRPKGAKGKISQTVKDSIQDALECRVNEIGQKLDQIKDPHQWISAYAKLAAFILPRREHIEVRQDKSID